RARRARYPPDADHGQIGALGDESHPPGRAHFEWISRKPTVLDSISVPERRRALGRGVRRDDPIETFALGHLDGFFDRAIGQIRREFHQQRTRARLAERFENPLEMLAVLEVAQSRCVRTRYIDHEIIAGSTALVGI